MIPAIIGAGASLLGGIFQSSSQRSAERRAQENRLNEFADLRVAADRGNIHFLTALAAGGLRQSVPVFTSPFGSVIAEVGGILSDGYARTQARQAQARDEAATHAAQRTTARALQRQADTAPSVGTAFAEDYRQYVEAVSRPQARAMSVIMPTGNRADMNRFAIPEIMRGELRNRQMTQSEYSQLFGFEAGESLVSQNPGRISATTGIPSPGEVYDATRTEWGSVYDRTVRPSFTIGREAARLDRAAGAIAQQAIEDASRALNPFTRLREAVFGRW